ncbi:hypothetical protein CC78DRAFT_575894 [Lojkania enalia]|uniref:Uncharacterized protein n=1 Tax=Lojkania enalia TaxID=147567 RepID=A0A9P4N965_9PLEO|nr:hypothetical protein CC78DRAFT_575894 [Didymosphaeria enalia]
MVETPADDHRSMPHAHPPPWAPNSICPGMQSTLSGHGGQVPRFSPSPADGSPTQEWAPYVGKNAARAQVTSDSIEMSPRHSVTGTSIENM